MSEEVFTLLLRRLTTLPEKYERINSFSRKDIPQHNIDIDEAALQKRLWGIVMAENYQFKRGLDLFGGIGHSGFILSKCCDSVTVIEKDPISFKILQENLTGVNNVNLINSNNLDFLKTCETKFDYIDFDPFGSPGKQLKYLNKIFDKGVVCITTGEILQISRNLRGAPEFAGRTGSNYIGRKARAWAEEVYIPYIESNFNLKCQAFYCYPTSVRLILSRDMKLDPSLFKGKNYLGWFENYAKSKTEQVQLI